MGGAACAPISSSQIVMIVAARKERHAGAVPRHFVQPEHVAVKRHRNRQAAYF